MHPAEVVVVDQPHRAEAVVRPGAVPIQRERPEDWGWHGEMGRWGRRLWILPFAVMLAYLFTSLIGTHHEGHVADLWLGGTALLMLVIVLRDWRRRKHAWRT